MRKSRLALRTCGVDRPTLPHSGPRAQVHGDPTSQPGPPLPSPARVWTGQPAHQAPCLTSRPRPLFNYFSGLGANAAIGIACPPGWTRGEIHGCPDNSDISQPLLCLGTSGTKCWLMGRGHSEKYGVPIKGGSVFSHPLCDGPDLSSLLRLRCRGWKSHMIKGTWVLTESPYEPSTTYS